MSGRVRADDACGIAATRILSSLSVVVAVADVVAFSLFTFNVRLDVKSVANRPIVTLIVEAVDSMLVVRAEPDTVCRGS